VTGPSGAEEHEPAVHSLVDGPGQLSVEQWYAWRVLQQASLLLPSRLGRLLRDRHGVIWSEYQVLTTLRRERQAAHLDAKEYEGVRIGTLAGELGVAHASAKQIVARLHPFVELSNDRADGRAVRAMLTERGEELALACDLDVAAFVRQRLVDITPDADLEAVRRVLAALCVRLAVEVDPRLPSPRAGGEVPELPYREEVRDG